jgi:hypothetical protein
MSRNELKEIIARIIVRLESEAPKPACLFTDNECDMTTKYAIGEEG